MISKVFAFVLSTFLVSMPLIAVAQGAPSLKNPLGYNSLTEFLKRLLQIVVMIGYPVIVLFIVYIGFQYIQAQGKPEKLKDVHSNFFWALVGSLLVLGAQALSIAIQATVNDLKAGV